MTNENTHKVFLEDMDGNEREIIISESSMEKAREWVALWVKDMDAKFGYRGWAFRIEEL